MLLSECGYTRGLRHAGPFGAEHSQRILLLHDRRAGLAQVNRSDAGFLGDPVQSETDEPGDGDEREIERTDHDGLSN